MRARDLRSTPVLVGVLSLIAASLGAQELGIVDTVCDVDLPTCSAGVQGLRGARIVAVSPDGNHAYVPAALDDALIVFERTTPSGRLTFVQSIFDTDPGIDGLDSARGAEVSPDGNHVYVVALVDSSLAAYSRSSTTGALTFVEVELDGVGGTDGLAGAHSVTVSPDGEHVYVAARSEDAVSVFERNPATGDLTFLEAHFDNVSGVDGLDAAEFIVVSPDGAHVYIAAETDNAVTAFARETDPGDPDFGKLTFVDAYFDGAGGIDGLEGADGVAVSPDGGNVYVACERGSGGGDWISVFARSAATGALTFVESFDEEDFGPYTGCTGVGSDNSGVAVSPDDAFVYATNPFRGTVAWFNRSPATGSLTLQDQICDLEFGTDGIAGAVAVTVSPDGRDLLTAASSFETIAVLTDAPIFADGFESGDVSSWSNTVP